MPSCARNPVHGKETWAGDASTFFVPGWLFFIEDDISKQRFL
jgi:hypothetical protein